MVPNRRLRRTERGYMATSVAAQARGRALVVYGVGFMLVVAAAMTLATGAAHARHYRVMASGKPDTEWKRSERLAIWALAGNKADQSLGAAGLLPSRPFVDTDSTKAAGSMQNSRVSLKCSVWSRLTGQSWGRSGFPSGASWPACGHEGRQQL